MKQKKINKCIIEMVLAVFGAVGILGTLLSCVSLSVSSVHMYIWAVVFACGIVYFMNLRENPAAKILIWAVRGITAAVLIIFSVRIYKGVCYIINDCIEVLQNAGNFSLTRIPVTAAQADQYIGMVFAAFVAALLVSIIVVYIRNMFCAILSIIPMMAIFVMFAVIPAVIPVICCFIYVFGVSALQKKDFKGAWVVMGMTVLVSAVCLLIIPPNQYKRPAVFVNMGRMINQGWRNLQSSGRFSLGGGTAEMGVHNGELGKIESLSYNNEPVMRMTTVYTGRNQYIAQFRGQEYVYGENRWTKAGMSTDLSITLRLVEMLDASQQMQNFLDSGSGAYHNKVHSYTQSIYDLTTKNKNMYDVCEIDWSYYSKIKQIAEGTMQFRVSQGTKAVYSQAKYNAEEQDVREDAYMDYLAVDSQIRRIVQAVVSNTNLQMKTIEEKIEYIRYIRDFLINNYTYTQSPGSVPQGEDFVKYFLLDSKQGYCTYFATAAVMMYRAAGIPARYVEGYAVSDEQLQQAEDIMLYQRLQQKEVRGKSLDIKDNAAHAWVEVYIDNIGWVPVEVTPSNQSGGIFGTGDRQIEISSQEDAGQQNTEPTEEETQPQSEEDTSQDNESTQVQEGQEQQTQPENFDMAGTENRHTGTILIVVFLLMILLLVCVRYIILKRRLSVLLQEGEIFALYQYLEKLLSHTPYKRPQNMSYEAYALYLEGKNTLFQRHQMQTVMEMVLKLRFGGENVEVSPDEIQMFREAVAGIREEVLMQMPPMKRFVMKRIRML